MQRTQNMTKVTRPPSLHTILKVICTGVGRVWEQDYLVPRPSYISNELTMVHCKYVML